MNITTLNISANAIKALSIHGTVVKKQEIILPPGSIRNGLILQPDIIGREIKSLFKNGKLAAGKVICTVNGLPFSYRMLTVPGMERTSYHEAVLRTAKKEMSISPDEMYLSWQAYPAENDEWQVLVTGITRHPVDNLIKALSEAGIRPWLMDLPHLALARLSPCKDAVIVDFEKDCSNIVMIVDGVPRGMHMVPALADGASLQDQLGQVTDKMAKMVEFYNSSHPVKPVKEPARVLVTGELLESENAFNYIQVQVGYPVETLNSGKNIPAIQFARQYAVNAGLLDIRTEDTGKDSAPYHYLNLDNIVKERRPKTDVPRFLKKTLVPFGIVVGLALLTVSCLSLGRVKDNIQALKTDLTQANAELTQKQATAGQAEQVRNSIEEITSRIGEIKAGHNTIFSSREYIDDISAIVASMPDGVTFNSLEVGNKEITLEGSSKDAFPVIDLADNLETVGGFAQAIIYWIDKPHGNPAGQLELFFKIVITKTVDNAG